MVKPRVALRPERGNVAHGQYRARRGRIPGKYSTAVASIVFLASWSRVASFPERTRACLSGSNIGGSCLKIGWVGLGLHMEFHAGGQWIITSHVCAIAVEPSPTGVPC